jgi:hypothetical protein
MGAAEELVQVAPRQEASYRQRQRLGRQPSRKMVRMVVESSSSMLAIGGHVVSPARFDESGQQIPGTGRVEITVLADEAERVMKMVETQPQLIAIAKEQLASEQIDALREHGFGDQLNSQEARDWVKNQSPLTWQASFYRANRRDPGPLCFAEKIEEVVGHPDKLDTDPEGDFTKDKMAAAIAAAVAAAIAPVVAELRQLRSGK